MLFRELKPQVIKFDYAKNMNEPDKATAAKFGFKGGDRKMAIVKRDGGPDEAISLWTFEPKPDGTLYSDFWNAWIIPLGDDRYILL